MRTECRTALEGRCGGIYTVEDLVGRVDMSKVAVTYSPSSFIAFVTG
jgi:hypothetical protein